MRIGLVCRFSNFYKFIVTEWGNLFYIVLILISITFLQTYTFREWVENLLEMKWMVEDEKDAEPVVTFTANFTPSS